MLYILILLSVIYLGISQRRPNLNVHGGTGGAGGQSGEQGGGGGTGEGPIVNVGPVTIVKHPGNKEEGMDASRLAFLDWFSPINFFLRHADISQVREKGTGRWLLAANVFQQWKSQFGRTLWCRGIPGAGKTILVSMVVDYLSAECQNTQDIGVACIYLNYKEADNQTPSKLLAGLWRQLVLNRDIGSDVKKLYQQHREKGTAPSLEEVASVLSASLKEFSKVFLIIDAMDEYPEFQQHVLLKYLAAMGSNVNLMITSRQNISPQAFSFENLQTLDIHATKEDLESYIDAQINFSPCLTEHIEEKPELREDIHAKIIGAVDGMFLLAKLHLESLSTKNTIKAVREALKELPKDLHDSYDIAMQRIDAQSKEDRRMARSTITWVVNAKRPLTVEELQVALAVEPGTQQLDKENFTTIKRILSVCAGLVIVDEQLSVVRLVHYTTQEYLDSIQAQQFPDAQMEITCTLLTFLAFDGYPDSFRDLRYLPPLAEYSQYCLAHATGQPEVQLREILLKFLGEAFRWNNIMKVWDSIPWNYSYRPLQPSALWIAVAANLVETTNFLLAGPPLPQHSMDPELIVASYYGHKKIVRILLDKGTDVNTAGGEYGSSLQAAAAGGHTEIVRILLEKGADINTAGGWYGSSLQAAAAKGHTDIVSILLDKGADVNAAGGRYGSSLQAAAAGGYTEIVSILLGKGADVNAAASFLTRALTSMQQGGEYGSALQAAADGGRTDIVSILLDKGADINATGGEYGSSLQAAAAGGYTGIVSILLAKGADINAAGGEYGSALRAAAAEGHTDIVGILLDKGADVNATGGEYGSSLQAAAAGGYPDIVSILLAKGADINAAGGPYGSSLQAAAARGDTNIFSILLDKGADVNATGGFYGSSLQAAATEGHTNIVGILLDKGADINAAGGRHGSSLQAAAAGGHTNIVGILLDKGADVNAAGGRCGSSLQAAAAGGYTDIVRILLDKGANVNAAGGQYGSSLQAANARGHTDIVSILLKRGARLPVPAENERDAQ
ncbi:ankyrin repeat domain-containing protein [Mycena alexandri]|uniref:Ankyrin repeat domain-containing protein n=1 Tax=Mycena alexandri TaxID=1745969 RepID=A0AAD6S6H4_9AGAR|nr:ankyrin repeat domain-containing protein [Mycena alexandri]